MLNHGTMVCWNMLLVFDTDWVNIFLNRPTKPRIAYEFDAWTSRLPVEPPFPLSMRPKMFVGLGIYVVVSMLWAIPSIPGVENNAKSTYYHYPSQRMAMVICPKNNSNIVKWCLLALMAGVMQFGQVNISECSYLWQILMVSREFRAGVPIVFHAESSEFPS